MTLRTPERADRWQEIRAFLESEQAAKVFPGAALVVSQRNKTLWTHCQGTYCATDRRDAPLDAKTIHPLYSFSKVVSATVVAMAQQEGLFDYDTPVATYLPEFAGGGKDRITVQHLLSHSAGIPNVPLGSVKTEAEWRAAVQTVCAAKAEWEPGSRCAYHALTGLFVAAEVVRRRMGNAPWTEICKTRLFDPIGAKSLTFAMPPEKAAVALTPQPKELPQTFAAAFPYAYHPAGGCFGTAQDALKILQLHLNQGVWRGKRLLTPAAWKAMHTVQYQKEIDEARTAGKALLHDYWGLGPLLRGVGAKTGSHDWFGFCDQTSPGIFGHAGIDTFIGVADPVGEKALIFVTTQSPPTPERTVALRNGVTNRVFDALKQSA